MKEICQNGSHPRKKKTQDQFRPITNMIWAGIIGNELVGPYGVEDGL